MKEGVEEQNNPIVQQKGTPPLIYAWVCTQCSKSELGRPHGRQFLKETNLIALTQVVLSVE